MAQMVRSSHRVDEEYLQQIEEAREELRDLLSQQRHLAPLVLRLAFHDAGTYDARTRRGGANGSIRNELNNPPNGGIKTAIDLCEPVKENHPRITYADLYQLAGVIAVEVTDGPEIDFVPGRRDALDQRDSGGLPNPNGGAQHLREIFHRMGLSDKDIVVLSGAHTLGRAHKQISGFDGPFTEEPLKFDNSYYLELIRGDTPGLVKFPTDEVLMEDPVFRRHVLEYARDEELFFEDYAEAHKKVSELGFRFHPHPRRNSQ